ncbi:MAG: hypothetical protein ABIP27_17460 [Flavobacterium circumlabens]|uniref:hypothetical protein n=1 Tax=Flavobacterium circumlabens TaxID=2133765 RepID=UPI0032636851
MNEEIKAEAIEVFGRFPLAKEVFVTDDVQAFLKEDRAKLHGLDYIKVLRTDVMPLENVETQDEETKDKSKPGKKSADELIALVPTIETIAELEDLEKGEKRATVLAAITARKEELTTK